jgi:hypothetical protein
VRSLRAREGDAAVVRRSSVESIVVGGGEGGGEGYLWANMEH